MVIASCRVELRIPMSDSLKYKRGIIKALLEQLKNKFNLAVAEIDQNDDWKLSTIGLVSVGNQSSHLEGLLETAIRFIERFDGVQVLKDEIQLL